MRSTSLRFGWTWSVFAAIALSLIAAHARARPATGNDPSVTNARRSAAPAGPGHGTGTTPTVRLMP